MEYRLYKNKSARIVFKNHISPIKKNSLATIFNFMEALKFSAFLITEKGKVRVKSSKKRKINDWRRRKYRESGRNG